MDLFELMKNKKNHIGDLFTSLRIYNLKKAKTFSEQKIFYSFDRTTITVDTKIARYSYNVVTKEFKVEGDIENKYESRHSGIQQIFEAWERSCLEN